MLNTEPIPMVTGSQSVSTNVTALDSENTGGFWKEETHFLIGCINSFYFVALKVSQDLRQGE